MLKEAIEKILSLADPTQQEIDGRCYTSKPIHAVLEPLVDEIKVHTLSGLVDYVKSGKDGFKPEDFVLHVETPDSVRLLSQIKGEFRQRERVLRVTRELHGDGFKFGQYHDAESFNVELQSRFERTDTRDKVLALAGNMTAGEKLTVADDGVTQGVTVQAGVTLVDRASVPNPVLLQPFRTFLEVDQPISPFIFRVKQGRDGALPTCALFEADGGKWKLEAIGSIAQYLGDKLPGVQVIA